MSRKIELGEYQKRGKTSAPGITYTGVRYEKATVLEAVCSKGHTFEQYAANQPKGRGCPVCSLEAPPKHSLESYTLLARVVHGPGFSYRELAARGQNTSILYTCPQGHENRQQMYDHLKGKGCGVCAEAKRRQGRAKSLSEWEAIFRQVHGQTYAYLSAAPDRYPSGGAFTLVRATCPTHGEITLNAEAHAQGAGCRACARAQVGQLAKLSADEFYNKASKKHKNKFTYAGDYTGAMQNITVICPTHGAFQQRAAGHAYDGHGCPRCVDKISAPNREIQSFLESLGVTTLLEHNLPGTRKFMDLFVPTKSLGIEYHGNIWHSTKHQRDTNSHRVRLAQAAAAGIRLIQIFSDEWTYRRNACELLLARAAGVPEEAVNARACQVVDVPVKQAAAFFDIWHVQGATTPSSTFVGIEFEGTLVAVMGFSFNTSSRAEKVSGSKVELTRFATCKNVRGGFSKLLQAWLRQHPEVVEVVSYSDNRLFLGRMYDACGFVKHGEVVIDYTYLDQRTDRRLHKSNFQKSKLRKLLGPDYDESKTELQLTEKMGLYRVYDCGKTRWVMSTRDETSSSPKAEHAASRG